MRTLIWILSSIWTIIFLLFLLKSSENQSAYYWIGVFVITFIPGFIISIVSGTIGAWKYNTYLTPAIINGIAVFIGYSLLFGLYFIKGSYFVRPSEILIIIIPPLIAFLLTLVFAGITGFCLSVGSELIAKVMKIALPISIVCTVFGIFAFYAANGILFEKDWFWKSPDKPDIVAIEIDNSNSSGFNRTNHILAVDKTSMQPVTGRYNTYKDKLKISPFPSKIKGVHYYIDGWLFGYSGTPEYLNKYPYDFIMQSTLPALYSIKTEQSHPVLVHKNYEDRVHNILNEYGHYIIVSHVEKEEDYFNKVIFYPPQEDIIYKRIIQYYPNGIIERIETYKYDMVNETEWIPVWDNHQSFDQLGYQTGKWSPKDFVLEQTIPDPLNTGEAKGSEKEELEQFFTELPYNKVPEANDFKWNKEHTTIENIATMYDAHWNTVGEVFFAYRPAKNEYVMDIEDQKELKRIFSLVQQLIVEPDIDNYGPYHTPIFCFLDEQTKKVIFVSYSSGRFILGNKFQSALIETPGDVEKIEQILEKYESNPYTLQIREKK